MNNICDVCHELLDDVYRCDYCDATVCESCIHRKGAEDELWGICDNCIEE
jgi:hypothetical protein